MGGGGGVYQDVFVDIIKRVHPIRLAEQSDSRRPRHPGTRRPGGRQVGVRRGVGQLSATSSGQQLPKECHPSSDPARCPSKPLVSSLLHSARTDLLSPPPPTHDRRADHRGSVCGCVWVGVGGGVCVVVVVVGGSGGREGGEERRGGGLVGWCVGGLVGGWVVVGGGKREVGVGVWEVGVCGGCGSDVCVQQRCLSIHADKCT